MRGSIAGAEVLEMQGKTGTGNRRYGRWQGIKESDDAEIEWGLE